MTETPPTARLLELTAENEALVPEHTHKAFMHRVNALESIEDRCELLEEGMAEFRRGLPASKNEKGT